MRSQLLRTVGGVVGATLTAWAVWLSSPPQSAAQQPPGCTIMGPAIDFGAVATKWLRSRPGRNRKFYYIPAPFFAGASCAPVMNLGRQGRFGDDVVATRDDKTAIRLGVLAAPNMCPVYGYPYPCAGPYYCAYVPPTYDYPCVAHKLWGDLVTGGGAIRSSNAGRMLPAMPYGVVDTTGEHAGVGNCEAAMAHVPVAAAALAQGLLPGEPPSAARPIIELGDVRVDRDDILTLTSTPGQDVTFYRAHNLVLQSGRIYRSYGSTYQAEGAVLRFSGTVVLNVTGRLRFGRATAVWDWSGSVINVVGRAGGVTLDKRAYVDTPIIAAERRINIRADGGGYEFPYGLTGQLLAERISVLGAGFVNYFGVFSPGDCS